MIFLIIRKGYRLARFKGILYSMIKIYLYTDCKIFSKR
jgi:hypothetical protein